ncbi:MAG: phage tail protein [Asticcacaulis sp.]
MMMSLGEFIFEIDSLPYQELARRSEWRHATAERFGLRASAQYVGPGADKITLTGALFPGEIGSWGAIETLSSMAATGGAFGLVAGTGEILGDWFIRSLDQRHSLFFIDGVARKADFTLELERFDG